MSVPQNVTATFTGLQGAQNIKNGSNYYGTMATAFAAPPANNDTLLIKSMTLFEYPTPVFNLPGVSITMRGGFVDSNFTVNSGAGSVISGGLKVKNGTIRAEKIIVRP
jgi:hypothetical protein